jgi:hypothetical protein
MENLELNKVLEFVAKIYDEKQQAIIDKIESKPKIYEIPYRSEDINELATDFPKAQAEFEVAELNKNNPFFKSRYADLMAVVNASRPALTKYRLSVAQDIISHPNGETLLHTLLLHSSGQWIESRMRVLPPKNDVQSMSSYITYLKRVAYSSLIGVVTGDEDDDGEVAVATQRETFAKGTALNAKYNPREEVNEVITREQREELEYELAEYPDIAEMVLDGLKIQSLADMPKSKFQVSAKRIRDIKNARNGIR